MYINNHNNRSRSFINIIDTFRVWRDSFATEIPKLNRGNLRKVTTFLTGHSILNYHLNKYKPDKIPKIVSQKRKLQITS